MGSGLLSKMTLRCVIPSTDSAITAEEIPTNASRVVRDLCSEITGSRANPRCQTGFIFGDEKTRWRCRFPQSVVGSSPTKMEMISLEALLKLGILKNKKAQTLRLGVELATAVMQLHSTKWLAESWGKGDVFVLQTSVQRQLVDGGISMCWGPLIDKPLVHRSFGTSQSPEVGRRPSVADYDKSLFSLGIVLTELALESPIEDLRMNSGVSSMMNPPSCEPAAANELYDNEDYKTAEQRLGEVFRTEQGDYGLAVERCIHGVDLPNSIPKRLDHPQYRDEVYVRIVSLLERNFEVWNWLALR